MNKKRVATESGVALRRWWKPWTWLRRDAPVRITRSAQQLEMILGNIKPVRNPLVDDDVAVVRRRGDARVLHETAAPSGRRAAVEEESDRAWRRLRERRVDHLKVGVE